MRVLGIDMGLKRTGLALSDETGTAIRFLPNLLARTRKEALEKILSLVTEFSIKIIVIGIPKAKTDASKAIAIRATGLKSALDETFKMQKLNVATHLWDESYTSKKAVKNLVKSDVALKKRRSLLDAASAAVLVEEFLQSKKSNG